MIATSEDLLVHTEEDFWRLPGDGLWEVVDGRAKLLPPNENQHQFIADGFTVLFHNRIRSIGLGYSVSTPNVQVPLSSEWFGNFRSRVPDLAVSIHKPPRKLYPLGKPPDLVIEILSTRRGNEERTGKIDDYARAGIGEYWIVDPFSRIVEVYLLHDGEYQLTRRGPNDSLRPQAFPGVAINPAEIWAALD